jgi:hypothetical protein
MSSFQRVCEMNEAFGNPKGNPNNINWDKVRSQCFNIAHEFVELLFALGLINEEELNEYKRIKNSCFYEAKQEPNLEKVRDALKDIEVFMHGAHHLMGIDGDKDLNSVVDGVMTRFIKDEQDKQATIAKHAAKGVTEVYFEGEFPKMIMKSAVDQPDAPKGKFLKSASYKEPIFYDVTKQE